VALDKEISSGDWSMTFANGWQGADLDDCVSLTKGTTYWIVWAPINGSQILARGGGNRPHVPWLVRRGLLMERSVHWTWKYNLFCCK
jgi:hypothetical protein